MGRPRRPKDRRQRRISQILQALRRGELTRAEATRRINELTPPDRRKTS